MGLLTFDVANATTRAANGGQSGPVGAIATRQISSVSTIEIRGTGLFYGPEVPVAVDDCTRDVRRADDAAEKSFSILRKEFVFHESESEPVKKGWTLAIVPLPSSRRGVMFPAIRPRLRSRGGARTIDDLKLETLRPLRGMTNHEIANVIEGNSVDVLETGRNYVASISYGLRFAGEVRPWPILTEETGYPGRWAKGARRPAAGEQWAMGAFPGKSPDDLIALLWHDSAFQDLLDLQRIWSRRSLPGGGTVGKTVELSDRLRAELAGEMKVAALQAMGGWGADADDHIDEPLTARVRHLLERAMDNLVKREKRAMDGGWEVAMGDGDEAADHPNSDGSDWSRAEDDIIDDIDSKRGKR